MRFFFVLSILLVFCASQSVAQNNVDIRLENAHALSEKLSIRGTNNKGAAVTIHLVGIEYLDRQSHITRIAINDLIDNAPVTCKPIDAINSQEIKAQCLNREDQDIGLSLIENGLVSASRASFDNSSFRSIYIDSEYDARRWRKGLWPTLNNISRSSQSTKENSETSFLSDTRFFVILATLIIGPFVSMLIVGIIIYGGFQRLISLQKYQIVSAQKKDRAMKEREKFILAASLEGEINTNRAKLEAFIIIYEELLKNLRDETKVPKYKTGGDIIHEAPSLSRNVYDSNMDKMDLLGPSIVSDLTSHYMDIEPNPNYKTFEPDSAIEDVTDFVASIIKQAEVMLEPMDKISGALNVIVRDKKSKSVQSI